MLRRLYRTSILSLSRAGWAQRTVTNWRFAWRAASRFVAGESLDKAIQVVQQLNERGIAATLDHLGEHTTNPDEAREAAQDVIHALEGIHRSGVHANVSIKLSQLGLVLDENLCHENLALILQRARALNNFIRIDMEDSALTEVTLRAWDWARQQSFENVGIVIQSYLYRSKDDVCHILESGGRVRLCKGAYDEPENVAFPKKKDVDASYDQLATLLLEATQNAGTPQISSDMRFPPIAAFATHDEARIQYAQAEARRLKLPKSALEFQMLYGIRRDLQDELARQGYPLRIYVPYGTHWFPYFMRRLAERPANLWFFLSNFVRR